MRLDVLVSAGCLIGLIACGGASESDPFKSGNDLAGAGGDKSEGGSAAGGRGGATSSTGGSPTPGTGGSATAGKGGDGSPGGAPGAGGSPDMMTPPDPAVKAQCESWCDGVTAAKCSKEPSKTECVLGCRALANSPVCNSLYAELFKCADGATFTCSKEGRAVPTGCEVEQGQVGLCLLSNPDKTIEKPCAAYCAKQDAAACPNKEPVKECTYGCQLASSLIPSCSTQWRTFASCAADAQVSCNASGDPVPGGCEAEYLLYLGCALAQAK